MFTVQSSILRRSKKERSIGSFQKEYLVAAVPFGPITNHRHAADRDGIAIEGLGIIPRPTVPCTPDTIDCICARTSTALLLILQVSDCFKVLESQVKLYISTNNLTKRMTGDCFRRLGRALLACSSDPCL